MQTFHRIQVGAREYPGPLKDEKQAHSQPFLTKSLTFCDLITFRKKGNIPPPIIMISYSSSPLALPDSESLIAVKSTYCFGFRMSLMSLWMTSVKDGTVRTDMAVRAQVQPVVLLASS
jgi:hypothetical protein